MRKTIFSLLILVSLFFAGSARADKGGVVRFATLPPAPAPGHPEGIAADAQGNIYVATFDFSTTNVIYIFAPNGRLQTTIPLPGAAPLGLAFDASGNLYVANFGGGNVLKFTPPFRSTSTPATTYTVCGGPPTCGLNAIAFDAAGDLYVSDSFGGNIFKIDLPGTTVSVFAFDELLKPAPPPHGFPGFGANGLAFSADGHSLFVANTADDRILKLDVTVSPPSISQFAQSINGADGIVFDNQGQLWVAANQADEVVALGSNGRVVDRRGSFDGLLSDGSVKGLLFPASVVISNGSLFVTNLALHLTADHSEPEEDVTIFTVSRIPLVTGK